MKTIAVFLCIVPFALIQATSVPTKNGPQLQAESIAHCIREKKADPDKIKEIFKNDILPENDPKFIDFFLCFWTEAGIIQSDGSISNTGIRIFFPQLIRARYPKLSEEESVKLSNDAVDHCINVPKGDSVGLKGIQLRNCLTKYALDKLS